MSKVWVNNARARIGLVAVLCVGLAGANGQTPHTPKPGSTERQAICDAARSFVLVKYATGTLPQAIVFKIDRLSVADRYANMQAISLFKDGTYVDPNYIPDIAFNFCLQSDGAMWRVVADLSRTDVPSADEAARIRRRLPADFPLSLLSPDWRKILGE